MQVVSFQIVNEISFNIQKELSNVHAEPNKLTQIQPT